VPYLSEIFYAEVHPRVFSLPALPHPFSLIHSSLNLLLWKT